MEPQRRAMIACVLLLLFCSWHASAAETWIEIRRVPDGGSDSGACGCCGMRISAGDGKVVALYRGAAEQVNRGMRLIETSTDLRQPRDREIDPMKFGASIVSTAAFGWNANNVLMLFDALGNAIPHAAGQRRDLPAWDSPAAFCGSDGSLTILY